MTRRSRPVPDAVREATGAVGRIHTRESIGTGFLVTLREIGGNKESTHAVITASHVISSQKDARGGKIVFDETIWCTLRPKRFFLADAMSDIAVCAVDASGEHPCSCVCASCIEEKGPIWICHHPRGSPLALDEGRIILQTGTPAFLHSIKTEPGSSGAPVFDATGCVVGVHVASNGLMMPGIVNPTPVFEASRLTTIVDRLKEKRVRIA